MILDMVRIAILIVITLIYALFDVYNKRNVPDAFVYSGLAIGVVATLTYGLSIAFTSILIALGIGGIGYVLYKNGQLGLGDSLEFATISLLLPIQPMPLLTSISQLGFPFIFSVFLATGIVTLVAVPLYYMLRSPSKKGMTSIGSAEILRTLLLFLAYLILAVYITYIFGIRIAALAIIIILAAASITISLFEKRINMGMIEFIYPRELEAGDMIAINFMSRKEIAFFKSKTSLFGRLASEDLIKKIKNVKVKLPVYKHAVPLALFTFIGTIISLLLGNVIFLLLV
ncbi:MAG: prepilin peptidase [Candidatus Micrarchaeaceae archaeon]